MIFYYQAKTQEGEEKSGTIEAASHDLAVAALQRRGFVIVSLKSAEERQSLWQKFLAVFQKIKDRDVVIFSRQLATLFASKVSVVDALRILIAESPSEVFRKNLTEVADDIQGGLPMSQAFGRHPEIFSNFYVQMVRSGEESGKLDNVLDYLADHLERSYDLSSKAKNAMIYPAFVLGAFLIVVVVMLVVVVPRISSITADLQASVPVYTRVIIGISNIIRSFGVFFLVLIALGAVFLWRYFRTPAGNKSLARIQLSIPVVKDFYRQIYLARFADNLQTMLSGGVAAIRALEISADVVGNAIYSEIIREAAEAIRSGSSISDAFGRYEDVPQLVTQMIKIGEETGKLNQILSTLARFYTREVNNTLDRMVSLIEPALIVALGLGVGIIVATIFVPIYSISSGI
ncbi:MAG: type II secretion system F family protein [Patescibacteria group bacterium]